MAASDETWLRMKQYQSISARIPVIKHIRVSYMSLNDSVSVFKVYLALHGRYLLFRAPPESSCSHLLRVARDKQTKRQNFAFIVRSMLYTPTLSHVAWPRLRELNGLKLQFCESRQDSVD